MTDQIARELLEVVNKMFISNDPVDALVEYCKKNNFHPPEYQAEQMEDGRYRVICKLNPRGKSNEQYGAAMRADTESTAKKQVSKIVLDGMYFTN